MKRKPAFLLLNQPAAAYDLPVFDDTGRIPKIIHQTYHSKAVPEAIAENIVALKARNPGWEHRLYDDHDVETFIENNYGTAVLGYYHRINPVYGAARADFFRYLLMYREGGVYLDIKSTAIRPLDEIILPDDRLILAHWGADYPYYGRHREFSQLLDDGEFQQWHIMCAPGQACLRRVIQTVMRNIDRYIPDMHGTGHYGVWRVTGPIAYTLAILPLLSAGNCRRIADHKDIGLVYSFYNGDHRTLFRADYRTLTEPVASQDLGRNLLSLLYTGYTRLRRGHARLRSGKPDLSK